MAQADLIVRAGLDAPSMQIEAAIRTAKPDYVQVRLKVLGTLKGMVADGIIEFNYYPEDRFYQPSPRAILALHGKEVIACLSRVDLPGGGSKLYLAGSSPRSVRAFDRREAESMRDEAANQLRIVQGFARLPSAKADETQPLVRDLIARMRDKETESKAFADLERLDRRGVPSMIRLMDDRRPLPIRHIMIANKAPDAFEGFRQYGPECVVDALAAILNQVTREDFGPIYNGASERQRQAAVSGWRDYLHYGCPAP